MKDNYLKLVYGEDKIITLHFLIALEKLRIAKNNESTHLLRWKKHKV